MSCGTLLIHAFCKHTSSTREVWLLSLRIAPCCVLRPLLIFAFVSLSFSRFVVCLAIVPVLCCPTHHMLELHRLNEVCVSISGFHVHVVLALAFPQDVLHLNPVFVRNCPRVLPLCVSHREAVTLCLWTRRSVEFLMCCTFPRVLSFRGVLLWFLRGVFFPKRVIMPLELTSKIVALFLFKLVPRIR